MFLCLINQVTDIFLRAPKTIENTILKTICSKENVIYNNNNEIILSFLALQFTSTVPIIRACFRTTKTAFGFSRHPRAVVLSGRLRLNLWTISNTDVRIRPPVTSRTWK